MTRARWMMATAACAVLWIACSDDSGNSGGAGATAGAAGDSGVGGDSGVSGKGGAPDGGTGGKAVGGSSGKDGGAGTGGAPAGGGAGGTGGTTPAGGSAGTGGTTPTGGSAGSGGTTPTGGSAGTGGTVTTGGSSGTGGSAGSPGCLSTPILTSLGKNRVLVGASMEDNIATQAPFDLRYLYLSGGLFDGTTPCQSCATNCTSGGQSCSNSVGCAWWGCWQWDQVPPGAYARDFITKNKGNSQISMFTYYEILQASGVNEGAPEVTQAATNQALMTRYLADWRFVLQQIGQDVAFLHIEPDFWGYGSQLNLNPHQLNAAVASANPTDCGAQENTIAGLGKCMIAMVRTYAPNAKVGLHASAWGTNFDVLNNTNPNLDVVGEANKLGGFLLECGAADGDFLVVETSDRDAGYYESIGSPRWWDVTNQKLPHFHQAFTWAKTLAEKVGKPLLWWQMPLGNMSLPGGADHWKDNRLDYFFAHMDEVAAAHGFGIAFGAGAGGQTTPSTDGGNLIAKMNAYVSGGGQNPCP